MRIEDQQNIGEQDYSEQTLEACVLAIAQWKGTLSPKLQQQIQEIGKHVSANDTAANELRNLLVNSELKDSYESARRELFQKGSVRERFKSGGEATLPRNRFISEIAEFVLTVEDMSAAARQLVTHPKWKARAASSSEDTQTFFQVLTDSVLGLDALAVELLTILDKDTYTLSQLAYRAERPEEQVEPVLNSLWHQNYVRPLSSTVLGNIFGPLNIFTPKPSTLPENAHYLGLTAKGYYALHPHPLYLALTQSK